MNRPLGTGEKWWWMADRAAPGHVVVVFRVRGPLEPDTLRRALRAAQDRHPLLGAHVATDGGVPRFVTDGTADIPVIVEEGELGDRWTEVAEAEVHRPFEGERHAHARAIVYQGGEHAEVVLVFGHVLGDAISLWSILLDILRFAAEIAEGREPEVRRLPERPSVDDMLPPQFKGREGLRMLGRATRGVMKTAAQRPKKLKPDVEAPVDQRRTRLIFRTLDEEVGRAIQERADQEATGVHGAIAAATLKALAADIGRGRKTTVAAQQTVNLRKMLRPRIPNKEIGVYGTAVVTAHRVDASTELWGLAREVTNGYRTAVSNGEHLGGLPLLKMAGRRYDRAGDQAPQRYLKAMTRASVATLFMTIVPPAPSRDFAIGPFEVDQMRGAGALGWFGEFGVAAPSGGEVLDVGFAYAEPAISRERAERLVDEAVANLERMSGVQRPQAARPAGASVA